MRQRWIGMVVAALALGSVAACGGSSSKGSSGGGSSDAAYCDQVRQYKAEADRFDQVFQNPTPDAALVKEAFETMQDLLHRLDKNPPAKIAEDVHTVRKGSDELIAIFSKYDYDTTKLAAAPEFQQLSALMGDGDMSAASDRLDAWGQQVCGITPDTTTA